MTYTKLARFVLPLVQAVIGIEWLKGAYEKLSEASYVSSMAGRLGAFASKNPTGWYADFLHNQAIQTFAYLVADGELLVGIALIVTAAILLANAVYPIGRLEEALTEGVAGLALLGGAFMSVNFWFAAGWMGVSTDGINYVMGLAQIVMLAGTIVALVSRVGSARPAVVKPVGHGTPAAGAV